MQTLLKKSVEQFIKEQNELYERIGVKEIVELKGNLYLDFKEYFHRMVSRGMFCKLPKNFAFDGNESDEMFVINLSELENSYIYKKAWFIVDETGEFIETGTSFGGDKLLKDKFLESIHELVKQMKQYYIDHDLQDK